MATLERSCRMVELIHVLWELWVLVVVDVMRWVILFLVLICFDLFYFFKSTFCQNSIIIIFEKFECFFNIHNESFILTYTNTCNVMIIYTIAFMPCSATKDDVSTSGLFSIVKTFYLCWSRVINLGRFFILLLFRYNVLS